MKYAVFFLLATIGTVYYISTSSHRLSWLLIYPALNFTILSVAYLLNRPSMVMGKTTTGQINRILLLINLPWLLLTWAIWLLETIFSQEDKINRIGQTNIYLGCYPWLTQTDNCDLIVDLTAEFPPCKAKTKAYICLPNLDGIQLRNTARLPQVSMNQKILIHCAQGHGRSATYASLLIAQLFPTISPQEALTLILESRPSAMPSKAQLSQIRSNSAGAADC